MITISVDVMGGDHGPVVTLAACRQFLAKHPDYLDDPPTISRAINDPAVGVPFADLILVITALIPVIGYEEAAKLAKKALATGAPIRELVVEAGLMSAEDVDAAVAVLSADGDAATEAADAAIAEVLEPGHDILIDDGLATGATMVAGIRHARRREDEARAGGEDRTTARHEVAQRLRELQEDTTAWHGREFTGQFSLAGAQANAREVRRALEICVDNANRAIFCNGAFQNQQRCLVCNLTLN